MTTVPLVVFRDGNLEKIGEAVLLEDGVVEESYFDQGVTLEEALKAGMVIGASLEESIYTLNKKAN